MERLKEREKEEFRKLVPKEKKPEPMQTENEDKQ